MPGVKLFATVSVAMEVIFVVLSGLALFRSCIFVAIRKRHGVARATVGCNFYGKGLTFECRVIKVGSIKMYIGGCINRHR